jgi:hypothetical protein
MAAPVTKSEILKAFAVFSVPTGGIGSWLTDTTHDDVFVRLGRINEEPLTAVQPTASTGSRSSGL